MSTTGAGIWGVTNGGRAVVGVVARVEGSDATTVDDASGIADDAEADGADDAAVGGGLFGTNLTGVLGAAVSDTIGDLSGAGQVGDVLGTAASVTEDVGVWGETRFGRGVVGAVREPGGAGVWGATTNGRAVVGVDAGVGNGVWGESGTGRAVVGVAGGPGTAIYGEKRGDGGFAGFFVGDVHVSGSISAGGDIVLVNADCAEDFDVEPGARVDPGMVMVVGPDGTLRPCDAAYDRRVAGVVSGAGTFRPALVLDRATPAQDRRPIALVGKVWCKVDATTSPVEMGDLLTSSATPGHAMRASDPARSFGAVVGKALADLRDGVGLVPILVALQ